MDDFYDAEGVDEFQDTESNNCKNDQDCESSNEKCIEGLCSNKIDISDSLTKYSSEDTDKPCWKLPLNNEYKTSKIMTNDILRYVNDYLKMDKSCFDKKLERVNCHHCLNITRKNLLRILRKFYLFDDDKISNMLKDILNFSFGDLQIQYILYIVTYRNSIIINDIYQKIYQKYHSLFKKKTPPGTEQIIPIELFDRITKDDDKISIIKALIYHKKDSLIILLFFLLEDCDENNIFLCLHNKLLETVREINKEWSRECRLKKKDSGTLKYFQEIGRNLLGLSGLSRKDEIKIKIYPKNINHLVYHNHLCDKDEVQFDPEPKKLREDPSLKQYLNCCIKSDNGTKKEPYPYIENISKKDLEDKTRNDLVKHVNKFNKDINENIINTRNLDRSQLKNQLTNRGYSKDVLQGKSQDELLKMTEVYNKRNNLKLITINEDDSKDSIIHKLTEKRQKLKKIFKKAALVTKITVRFSNFYQSPKIARNELENFIMTGVNDKEDKINHLMSSYEIATKKFNDFSKIISENLMKADKSYLETIYFEYLDKAYEILNLQLSKKNTQNINSKLLNNNVKEKSYLETFVQFSKNIALVGIEKFGETVYWILHHPDTARVISTCILETKNQICQEIRITAKKNSIFSSINDRLNSLKEIYDKAVNFFMNIKDFIKPYIDIFTNLLKSLLSVIPYIDKIIDFVTNLLLVALSSTVRSKVIILIETYGLNKFWEIFNLNSCLLFKSSKEDNNFIKNQTNLIFGEERVPINMCYKGGNSIVKSCISEMSDSELNSISKDLDINKDYLIKDDDYIKLINLGYNENDIKKNGSKLINNYNTSISKVGIPKWENDYKDNTKTLFKQRKSYDKKIYNLTYNLVKSLVDDKDLYNKLVNFWQIKIKYTFHQIIDAKRGEEFLDTLKGRFTSKLSKLYLTGVTGYLRLISNLKILISNSNTSIRSSPEEMDLKLSKYIDKYLYSIEKICTWIDFYIKTLEKWPPEKDDDGNAMKGLIELFDNLIRKRYPKHKDTNKTEIIEYELCQIDGDPKKKESKMPFQNDESWTKKKWNKYSKNCYRVPNNFELEKNPYNTLPVECKDDKICPENLSKNLEQFRLSYLGKNERYHTPYQSGNNPFSEYKEGTGDGSNSLFNSYSIGSFTAGISGHTIELSLFLRLFFGDGEDIGRSTPLNFRDKTFLYEQSYCSSDVKKGQLCDLNISKILCLTGLIWMIRYNHHSLREICLGALLLQKTNYRNQSLFHQIIELYSVNKKVDTSISIPLSKVRVTEASDDSIKNIRWIPNLPLQKGGNSGIWINNLDKFTNLILNIKKILTDEKLRDFLSYHQTLRILPDRKNKFKNIIDEGTNIVLKNDKLTNSLLKRYFRSIKLIFQLGINKKYNLPYYSIEELIENLKNEVIKKKNPNKIIETKIISLFGGREIWEHNLKIYIKGDTDSLKELKSISEIEIYK